MPRTRAKKKSGKGDVTGMYGPSASTVVYTGPLRQPVGDRGGVDTIKVELHEATDVPFTSSAGGVINFNFAMTPITAADWTSWASVYGEARLLGCRVQFLPRNRYSKSTTVTTPMISNVIHSTAAPSITSYTDAMAASSAEERSLEDPWAVEFRMSGTEEALFKDIGGVTTIGNIHLYADGLSLSTVYGKACIYWLVQFRGRL